MSRVWNNLQVGKHMKLYASLLAIGVVASIGGCSGCQPEVGNVKAGSITGRAIKGVLAGADVTVFAVDEDGRRQEELGTAETADDGTFTVDTKGHAGNALVCAAGGTYTEESTGSLVQAGPLELCALVEGLELGEARADVLLTPWSTMHAELSSCFVELGREASIEAGSNRAALRLNDFLAAGVAGFDFASTVPTDVTSATGLSLSPEAWAGILLAGLSETATAISAANGVTPGVRFTGLSLADAVRRDLAGGCVLDGVGVGGAALAEGTVALSADTLRGAPGGLAQSIATFLRGARNTSGLNEGSVADLTRALSSHTSEIFAGGGSGDLDAPVILIVEPAAGPVSGSPTIRVTATDSGGIQTLRFTSPTFLVDQGTLECNEPKTECSLTTTLNTSLIEDGAATIGVEAVDVAGNRRAASIDVTVNNTAPTIQLASPSDGSSVEGIVSVVATASDPEGLTSFVVDIPGTIVTANCAPPVLINNCDSDPNPLRIAIQWDTTLANEGPTTISFTATDTSGQSAFASTDVVVDNLAAGVFNGRIDLGAPVVGGSVSIFELNADGSRGSLLGTDNEIGADGAYQVEDATSHTGPLLVVATGGEFVDVASGLGLALSAGQELLAAVEAGSPGGAVVANVNAWTTLAARRALSHPTDAATIGDTIALNRRLFEAFFRRPSPEAPLPILRTVSAALSDDTPDPEASDGALLALTHAGLSRLAADTSVVTGTSVGSITIVDVVSALARDLEDPAGQFNGRGINDVEIHLDAANTVDVDSLTPRARLAIAIFAFTSNAQVGNVAQPRNKSAITAASIAQPNRLLDDVALYAEPRLFQEDQPPEPFDRDPPTVDFTFGAPFQDEPAGATLSGPVNIFGVASDVSDIVRFEIIAPDELVGDDLLSTVEDLGVLVGTRVAPNAVDVALTCGLVAGDPPLEFDNLERQVCVCAEATDVAANTGVGVTCFARADVTGSITPPPSAVLPLQLPTFTFSGQSGLDIDACSITVFIDRDTTNEQSTARIQGTVNGTTCIVSVAGVGFSDNPFTLQGASSLLALPLSVEVAVDEASGAEKLFNFSYVVDAVLPTVAITSPAAGASLRTPPLIAATASDGGSGLATVTAVVRVGANNVIATLTGTVSNGAVTFPAFTDTVPDGERVIEIAAVDVAGNRTVQTRTYVKDTVAPTITQAADQLPFLPMTSNASTLSGDCNTFPFATCTISPSGSLAPREPSPAAASAPLYQRWGHLAGDSAFSPPSWTTLTEAGVFIKARVDATCPTSQALFDSRPGQGFTADANGLSRILIGDFTGLSSVLHRNELNAGTRCLSVQATDKAGNQSEIVKRFYRYEAIPAPVLVRWNIGPYTGIQLPEDVGSFGNAPHEAVGGTNQGTIGRYFAHAYVIAPYSSGYNYQFQIAAPTQPALKVTANTERTISRTRASQWCLASSSNHELNSPARQLIQQAPTPADLPTWTNSAAAIDDSAGVKLREISVPGPSTSTAGARVLASGADHPPLPSATLSTTADTKTQAGAFTMTAPISGLILETWSVNQLNGTPTQQLASNASTQFVTVGGSGGAFGSRVFMLLARGRVPNNGISLKTHQQIKNTNLLYNDAQCRQANAMPTQPNGDYAVVDRDEASTTTTGGLDPVIPTVFLYLKSGAFGICDGTSTRDCRYGMEFSRFLQANFAFSSGTTLTPRARILASTGNSTAFATAAVPTTAARTLE